jgi:hypothetical protein
MQPCRNPLCSCSRCVDLRSALVYQRMMRHMSVETFERIRARLLIPFLMGISNLVPALFPSQWVGTPPVLQRPGDAGDSLRSEFRFLCAMVGLWQTLVRRDGSLDARTIIFSVSSRGDSLLTWLTTRRRWLFGFVSPSDHRVVRLRMQARLLRGSDAVFSNFYTEVLSIVYRVRDPLDIESMCRIALGCGAVERIRTLAREYRLRFRDRALARYLSSLEAALDAKQSFENECLVAVAMALHPRLGAFSSLAAVGRDLLPYCAPRLEQEPLLCWREVV